MARSRLLIAFIVTGMFFMLVPGTFLGVMNLIHISQAAAPSTPWIQAHGHAQFFGWIGTFILGIGLYSLPKMKNTPAVDAARGWTCYLLWTGGVALRWWTNISLWQWKWMLPISAAMELAAFLVFFIAVRGHRSSDPAAPRFPVWVQCVVFGTVGMGLTLVYNLAVSLCLTQISASPAFPTNLNLRMLTFTTWMFLVPTVWGFSARWLPTFLGLPDHSPRRLQSALALLLAGNICALFAFVLAAQILFLAGVLTALSGLQVAGPSQRPAKTEGVHISFPWFVRLAYLWLFIAASLAIWAAVADVHNGIWGASRHAVTVGFLSGMVFAIGQRVLPAFAAMRVLFSPKLMLLSLLLLHVGCFLRVVNEILAYEGFAQWAWKVLPVSAVLELSAVTVFALNMILTFLSIPPHLRKNA